MSRGRIYDVNRMVENLSSLHVPITPTNHEGKKENWVAECVLQPIQFWSYTFPREHLQTMLTTLRPMNQIGFSYPKGHDGYGYEAGKLRSALWAMRKGLKLDKIPEWNPEGLRFPVWTQNVQIVGIGIKEDYENKLGNECY